MVYVMVYDRETYTVPQTLCTSGFQRGDGIWVYGIQACHVKVKDYYKIILNVG